MRTKIIIGNWKMNRDRKETIDFLITLNHMISKNHLLTDHLNIVLAPSFLSLIAAKTYINRGGLFTKNWLKKLIISAQDANSEIAGSYTGAVSYNQLKEEGIQYSIIGHYETRRMFHYTDEDINKKIISLTNNGMSAILCVGDSKEDKDNNVSISVVLEQVEKALKGVLIDNLENIIIAYEPIYSIGIGVPVPVGDIIEMINAIRNKISQLYSVDASNIDCGGGVQLCECTKNHSWVQFKWVNFIICELFFNKAVNRKTKTRTDHVTPFLKNPPNVFQFCLQQILNFLL